jgi:hypothetical protein
MKKIKLHERLKRDIKGSFGSESAMLQQTQQAFVETFRLEGIKNKALRRFNLLKAKRKVDEKTHELLLTLENMRDLFGEKSNQFKLAQARLREHLKILSKVMK